MSTCNERLAWAHVTEIRRLYQAGTRVRVLAEKYELSEKYVYEILAGCCRQSEDARRPILGPPKRAREFLRHPSGNLFIRRGSRRMFVKQIPDGVRAQIRHARKINNTPLSDLAVSF